VVPAGLPAHGAVGSQAGHIAALGGHQDVAIGQHAGVVQVSARQPIAGLHPARGVDPRHGVGAHAPAQFVVFKKESTHGAVVQGAVILSLSRGALGADLAVDAAQPQRAVGRQGHGGGGHGLGRGFSRRAISGF
jgi:hypothetical protein